MSDCERSEVQQSPKTIPPHSPIALCTLEIMIDTHGLGCVLEMIREICYEKANHIAVQWQDVGLAKQWIAWGIRVNSVRQTIKD